MTLPEKQYNGGDFEELTREDWRNILVRIYLPSIVTGIGTFFLLLFGVKAWVLLVYLFVVCSSWGFWFGLWILRTYGRGYHCYECGQTFEVSIPLYFLPFCSGVTTWWRWESYLKCPQCGERSFKRWMKKIRD